MNHLKTVCFLLLIILLNIFLEKNLYASSQDNFMFKKETNTQPSLRLKNLANISFREKADIERTIDELINLSKNPYAASLPLIASAELGDEKRYALTLTNMLNALHNLDNTSDSALKWMQNHSFKAWMWGRILLAADSMGDNDTIIKAHKKLKEFLEKDFADNDNFTFITWAWSYRAALNQNEYIISKDKMLDHAMRLTEKYKASGSHEMLSDTLWAWIMNLQAAAYAQDQELYHWIKNEIKLITGEKSVTQALEKCLLRTTESNDYPAWAMAKTRYAAIVINDKELYQEIENSLISSINGAIERDAKAEFVLSILDNQLAILRYS